MPKSETEFICQSCGWAHPRWVGQCSQCGEWNSLVEEQIEQTTRVSATSSKPAKSMSLPEVERLSRSFSRFSTGFDELDRVLGSTSAEKGVVQGSVILLAGEPGIGKSTFLTQIGLNMQMSTKKTQKEPVVAYLCGEENPEQILLRIKRLSKSEHKSWEFFTSQQIEPSLSALTKMKPSFVIADSIQSFRSGTLTGAAGSVGQVRMVTDKLTEWAKKNNIPVFIVGHVTKGGGIAGPKVLEHIVDVVLEISGERTTDLRLVRAHKNRFGATDEVGVFQMTEAGMEEVLNPSAMLVQSSTAGIPGSVLAGILEGSRPLLIELQALVVRSQLAMPRRVGRGVALSRIQVLAAVLEKHCGLRSSEHDIFLSVAGGLVVREPAIDLGCAVAIASSLANKPVPREIAFVGEVGLLGEVRSVAFGESRIKGLKRLGVSKVISHQTHNTVVAVLKELKLIS